LKERTGVLGLFIAEVFNGFKQEKSKTMKKIVDYSQKQSAPKLNFTYHKAKRFGLVPECLPKRREAWGLVSMKMREIRCVDSTTKYCIGRKTTGHSFRIDVMAGRRPPGFP